MKQVNELKDVGMQKTLQTVYESTIKSIKSKFLLKILWITSLISAGFCAKGQAPGNTPVLTNYSFNLPFAIDGHVVRQSFGANAPGDWTTSLPQYPTGGVFHPTTGMNTLYPITLTQHIVDAYSVNDDMFTNGSKAKDDPNTQWTWGYGPNGGKDDMNHALVHIAKDAADNTWVMLSADRMSQNGTSYIDFSFLQAPLSRNANGTFTSGASAATGGRTPNDIMVTMEYTNGGSNPNIYYYKWQLAGAVYDWVPFSPPANTAYVSTNLTATSVPYGAFGSTTYPVHAFLEAAVNVTAFVTIADPCGGAGFSSLFIKTKSSNTATAVLKDIIGPIQLKFDVGYVVSAVADSISCFGGSTTLTANVTGGVPPFSYSLNGGTFQSPNTFTVSAGGPYTITVKDGNNCTKSTNTVYISEPAILAGTINKTDVACFGNTTGSATVTASGGKTPYTYSWNTTPVQTNPTASNLSAGTYTVTITDSNGCTKNVTTTITQPSAPLTASIVSQTNVLCYGNATGSATASGNGGTNPYAYSWNTSPVQTTATASNLPAGIYTVTVTDSNNCVQTAQVTITQPSSPINTNIANVNHVLCFGNATGSATVNASGGTGIFSYTWNTSPIQTGATASGLAAGTYVMTVTDANGCFKNDTAIISQPSAPVTVTIPNKTDVLCFGNTTGSATGNATGGTPPYSYSWNTSPVQSTETASGLAAGTYTLTVTDANNCSQSASITIAQPQPLNASISGKNDALCFGSATGNATVNVTGGTTPYGYSWNSSPAQTTPTAVNLAAGNYNVLVTDNNGCITTQSVLINQPPVLNATVASSTQPSCNGGNNGSASITVNGGTAPYYYSWNTNPVQTTANATGLSAGIYFVTVTDANGCVSNANVTVTQPQELTANTYITHVSCYNGTNGTATVAVTGGVMPYTYSWNTSPIQNTSSISSMPSGTYSVTITDANGCIDTATAIINMPPAPLSLAPGNAINISCYGGNNGSVSVNATGGTAPYNYNWNTVPVQNTQTAGSLAAGTYKVTVADANGCPDTLSLTIVQPDDLLVTPIPLNGTCPENSSGSGAVTVTGGTAPYTYSWNTPTFQNTDTINNLPVGTYTATVTDANGCKKSASVNVISFPAPDVNAGADLVLCEGSTVQLHATGAISYLWSPATTLSCSTCSDPVASPKNTTIYTVVGINEHSCTDSDFVEVKVLNRGPVGIDPDKEICEGESVQLNAFGGGTYVWSPATGLNNPFIANPTADVKETIEYSVVITQNECFSDTLKQRVTVHPIPTIDLGPDYTGVAGTTYQINAQVTNAVNIIWTPSTYLNCNDCYDPIATLTEDITYTAKVTSAFGCPATDDITLKVICDNVLFIPNTFTPNADGVNDYFYPVGEGIKHINLFSVYNRWGQELFHVENFQPNDHKYGWDGRFKGEVLTPDVYVYMIDAVCKRGDRVFYKGDISLIR